jgi:hypothetical protein
VNKLYITATLALCVVVIVGAGPWQKCDESCVENRSRTMIAYPSEYIQPSATLTPEEHSRAVRGEPEQIPVIKTVNQFIKHIESKLARYQKMLKQVEQEQARNREGTEEKFEAERAKGGPQADGPPAWIFYEKRKEKLNKKIQNAESKIGILKKCSHK